MATDGGGVEEFRDNLLERFFDTELRGENRRVVERAIEHLWAEDWDEAVAGLRDRFESVCETTNPALQETDHPAACHRFDQPD
jgi:peptide/nickel transport system ATP-binding protein